MADEIVLRSMDDVKSLSSTLVASAMIPAVLRKSPADVFAIVLTGLERGLKPMQALSSIHIIQGKPTMSADLMGALVQREGACEYLMLVKSTDKLATYRTKRRNHPEPVEMSFTIEQAKRAGLLSNGTWLKYPEAMLRARCLAIICRAVYPDLCLGLYDSDSGELTDGEPAGGVPAPMASDAKEQIQQTKDKLRDAVNKAPPKGDFIDGEVVSEKPAEPKTPPADVTTFEKPPAPAQTLAERVAAANKDELMKLVPELQARGAEGKKLFEDRKAQLIGAAKGGGI